MTKILAAFPLAALVAIAAASTSTTPQADLIVHEWGTFTSIAGADGTAMPWGPLAGRTDLPCFVHRTKGTPPKSSLRTSVRMETPVLYFYAPAPQTVDVAVGFHEGLITEYFPAGTVSGDLSLFQGSRSQIT